MMVWRGEGGEGKMKEVIEKRRVCLIARSCSCLEGPQARSSYGSRPPVKVRELQTRKLTTLGCWLDDLELLAIVDARLEFLCLGDNGAEIMLKGTCSLDAVKGRHQLVVFHGQRRGAGSDKECGDDISAVSLDGLVVRGRLWRHAD